ncbi:hypothetical protein EFO30_11255 [Lactococcus lactis]|uniref:Uncharacterized protein n=1 Tax=Lactococcus lactis subsp. cremoris TaxID=1359 RepID=A0ABR5EJV4_LACLC|nr:MULTISPECIES: hypothetical protein [Lactococcus]KKW74861.1 hypothetical protein VN93_0239 [Lactococcus cremoris]MCT3085986.1 hypothetical protein [Lactococcus lactis]MCT3123531.1 hypothetical protein [Lactococcus lactis]MCT3130211.1 hypothetical protein [Lactococcus lactis]TNU79326.1 hypothetical protein FIB60_06140 [Lactococcus cremoris]
MVVNYNYSPIVEVQKDFAIESLKKYRKNEEILKKTIKKRVKKNIELTEYLQDIINIEDSNINYVDKFIKSSVFSSKYKKFIKKYSDVLSDTLELEINGDERNSKEASINILYDAHSSLNDKLEKIAKKEAELTKNDNPLTEDSFSFRSIPNSNKEIIFVFNK